MCGLFASRDTQKLKELFDLNSRRGQTRMSITECHISDLDFTVGDINTFPDVGPDRIDLVARGAFRLVHIQAPTDPLNVESHPSMHPNGYLWHNGIIKESTIKHLQQTYGIPDVTWDTRLMHIGMVTEKLMSDDPKRLGAFLSKLDGSFACFYADGFCDLLVFRNAISPLFYDDQMNFSSVKFDNSKSIPHGVVWKVDFHYNQLIDTGIHFTTQNDPYDL